MPHTRVLFWFDVEDCMLPQSDDAAKRLAQILSRLGVRGTMKVVGQKARLLEQRLRYDVIDALQAHDIGFHSNLHGLRPQIAEYLAPLDFERGAAEFARREGPGLDDVRRLFGAPVVTYGQPGPNWAPQPFAVLRRWGIPTYVSGFGYVGVDCQPFWYGGVLCTSHMHGRRLDGREQRHLMGLNFELGTPGELEQHQAAFGRSLDQLRGEGGLISILNHPCTLVMEEWFSTAMKPRELTEAGYRHFEAFVRWVLEQPGVSTTCASELPTLYPDRAVGRSFGRDELRAIAAALTGEISFVRLGDAAVSAAEAFGLLAEGVGEWLEWGAWPEAVRWRWIDHPARHAPAAGPAQSGLGWRELRAALPAVRHALRERGAVPAAVSVAGAQVAPADCLAALARAAGSILDGREPEDQRLAPARCAFEDFVDEAAARSGWASVMMRPGFAAPNLLNLAKLGAWTLKPATLAGG